MSIDTAAILAEQYKNNPNPLRAAVLGQGTDINPYAALRALQLQKVAERYEMMQAALAGQQAQNQPSMVEQALAPTQMPQMPQQGMPQQPQPQMPQQGGLPQMQQPQPASQGLAGMPAPEGEYAGGGIVAFAGDEGSLVGEDEVAALPGDQVAIDELMSSPGDPASYAQFSRMIGPAMRNIAAQKYVPISETAYNEAIAKRRKALEEGAGEDPTVAYAEQLGAMDADRQKSLDQASGFGLLAAAGDMLQPGGGGLAAGIGRAAKTYGGAMQQAHAADKAEKRAIMSMKFNIADAQRKERMGLTRDALAAAEQARKDHDAAQMFKIKKSQALANTAIAGARATKPTGGSGGAKEPKGYDNLTNSIYQDMLADPQYAGVPKTKLKAMSAKEAANLWGKLPGAESGDIKREATETRQGKDVNEALAKWENSREAANAKADGTYKKAREAKRAELESVYPTRNKKSSETENSGKVVTQADIDATVAKSGRSEAEVKAALKQQGYTIK